MTATIVLVHGAFHGAWCWHKVVTGLVESGHDVIPLDLPGRAAGDVEAPADLYGDAAHVRKALDQIDGCVMLVGHSYGGAVITQAAAGHPKVVRLVYLAAVMPDEGESVATAIPPGASALPPDTPGGRLMIPQADGLTLRLDPEHAPEAYYHDCAPEDVDQAVSRLGPQAIASIMQPLTGAAWRTIPSTYIVCEEDRALPPDHQRAYATRAHEVLTIPTSHSPFLSRPDLLIDILAATLEKTARADHGRA